MLLSPKFQNIFVVNSQNRPYQILKAATVAHRTIEKELFIVFFYGKSNFLGYKILNHVYIYIYIYIYIYTLELS